MRKTLCSMLLFMAEACLAQQPSINANGVLDAAIYTGTIAPGGLFVVRGASLSASGIHCASLPLPTQLAGASISFVPLFGGAGIDAFLWCTYNQDGVNQLTGLLPSAVIPGDYNVFVTSDGSISEPAKVTVVSRKFGIMTVSGTGSGRAVVQTYISPGRMDLNRFTTGIYTGTNPLTHSPARPGQTLVVWGTGLGAIDTPDNTAPGAVDFRSLTEIIVIVGTRAIVPNYAGRAPGFPGVDVVHFELPPDVETGCTVPLQVWAEDRLSNQTTVAIAPAGADSCIHRELSKDALSRLDAGGTVVTGWFVLNSHFFMESILGAGPWPAINEWAGGGFFRYTADQLAGAFGPLVEEGTCRVLTLSGSWDGLLRGSGGIALDAGSQLKASGPSGDWQLSRRPDSYYYGTNHIDLAGPSENLAGGGGKDIGAFSVSLWQPSPLSVNPIPDNQVGRKVGVTLRWSGGGSSLVSIVGTNPGRAAFVCTTRADRGFFTVPSSVLTQAFPNAGEGELIVIAEVPPGSQYGRFNAPLTAGGDIDYGVWLSPALYQPVILYY